MCAAKSQRNVQIKNKIFLGFQTILNPKNVFSVKIITRNQNAIMNEESYTDDTQSIKLEIKIKNLVNPVTFLSLKNCVKKCEYKLVKTNLRAFDYFPLCEYECITQDMRV